MLEAGSQQQVARRLVAHGSVQVFAFLPARAVSKGLGPFPHCVTPLPRQKLRGPIPLAKKGRRGRLAYPPPAVAT